MTNNSKLAASVIISFVTLVVIFIIGFLTNNTDILYELTLFTNFCLCIILLTVLLISIIRNIKWLLAQRYLKKHGFRINMLFIALNSSLFVDAISKKFAIKTKNEKAKIYKFSDLQQFVLDESEEPGYGKVSLNIPATIVGSIIAVFAGVGFYSFRRERCIYCTKFHIKLIVKGSNESTLSFDLVKRKIDERSKRYKAILNKALEATDILEYIQSDSSNQIKTCRSADYS